MLTSATGLSAFPGVDEPARNVNRSLVCGFDCVPSFHSGEGLSRRARVQSQVERSEPEGNLEGFLARLHHSQQNEGKAAVPLGEVGFINALTLVKSAAGMGVWGLQFSTSATPDFVSNSVSHTASPLGE